MFEKIETWWRIPEDETDVCIIPNCVKHCLDIYSECYSDKELQFLKDGFFKVLIDYLIEIMATVPGGEAQIEDLKNCPNDGVCPYTNNLAVDLKHLFDRFGTGKCSKEQFPAIPIPCLNGMYTRCQSPKYEKWILTLGVRSGNEH